MSEATEVLNAPETATPGKRTSQIALLLLSLGVLILLTWVGLKAWRVFQSTSSLLARQGELEQLAQNGWGTADPNALEATVLGAHRDVVALKNELAFLMPVLPYFSWLPEVGGLAKAAPALLEMADAGTEAAAYAVRGMKPALAVLQSEEQSNPLIPQLLATVNDAQPDLARAALALERAADARAQIDDLEALPWRVRTLLETGDKYLTLGQGFARMSLVLPELMGLNGPRRYLILAQNQDELRPTGGFISGAGLLEVQNGEFKELSFIDANLVDAWENADFTGGRLTKPYSSPPEPLQSFMLLDLFLFRDANFWPDFAVSGQKAMELYEYGRNAAPLDGVIGINQRFLARLVDGTGPVRIADTGQVVGSNNVIESLQEAWTLEGGVIERKAFMGPFALAIMDQINGNFAQIEPLRLVQRLGESLESKDLQVFLRDPLAAQVLASNGWDGRMRTTGNHDSLMIVDTNMGYNKANIFVDRTAAYDVRLAPDGAAEARLTVTHIHNGLADGEECRQGTLDEYVEGANYLALTDKCYWNYLRIYVPEGSELISGPQPLISGQTWFGGYDWQRPTGSVAELPGFTTFDSWMLLPRGGETTSEFHYMLPDSISQATGDTRLYRLQLIRQAGTEPYFVQVSITLPEGASLQEAVPQPVATEGNTYRFTIEMDRDQSIGLSYR